ncbi:hypothetical protein PVL29_016509 [Vitis rotundifolia]|uniref:WRKY domain-containing protein n=1 Tax=Vitis rotundifolia TaxID=103349 RepID=A0AA38Z881_VITRO|nr:hypothetical protein PVL29_016509 [Vitis rotundifolia]
MGTSPPERLSTDQKRVVGELVHGQDLANQLQILLREPFSDLRSVSAEDLVVKILRSFTEALAVLRCYDQSGEAGGGSPAESGNCKVLKNRRGCYKRRKNSETWTAVSSTIEDGHAWRKYGQKEILNAKFPRSYYRCTRKHEQGCRATKQVQRMKENPILYHTTYIGHHTCRDILKAPQFIGGSYPGYDSNNMVGSESKIPEEVQEMKPELMKEETVVSDLTADNVSSFDSINLWSGLEALDSSVPAMVTPRGGSDTHGNQDQDVDSTMYSRNATTTTTATTASHNTDMDFVLGCLDFEGGDQFQFDESPFQFF